MNEDPDPDTYEPNWYLWYTPDGRTFWGPSIVRMIEEDLLEQMVEEEPDERA